MLINDVQLMQQGDHWHVGLIPRLREFEGLQLLNNRHGFFIDAANLEETTAAGWLTPFGVAEESRFVIKYRELCVIKRSPTLDDGHFIDRMIK